MIDFRFLCGDTSLYWHEPSGVLNSERNHQGKPGKLVFEKDADYPAFYVYDKLKNDYFWLVAVDRYSENAFLIFPRHVSTEEMRTFLTDYHPRYAHEIGYPIKNPQKTTA